MRRLLCALVGHDWKEHPFTRNLQYAAPFCECYRCGKRGWRL